MKLFFKKINKLKERGGFTMVETLVAVSIFSISLLGIMSVLANGISDTNAAKRKMIAAYLAQEGIEYIRNKRDTQALSTSWLAFKNEMNQCNGSGINVCDFVGDEFKRCNEIADCKLYINNNKYDHVVGTDNYSGFTRRVWRADVSGNGTNELKVFSEVKWTQGSGEQSVTFSENLFNWIE